MTTYEVYENLGKKPLWECIMIWHPHVDEENAKRIAEEAYATPVSAPKQHIWAARQWTIVKHISDETKKLKNA
jgi:hypothetical protein